MKAGKCWYVSVPELNLSAAHLALEPSANKGEESSKCSLRGTEARHQTYFCRRARHLRFQNSNKLKERKLMGLFMQMQVGTEDEDWMTPSLWTGDGPEARLVLPGLSAHLLEG
ncbi:unnamed protein product [Leuciscus chuanchicus]